MRAPHFFCARSCGRDGAKMIRCVHVGARSCLGLWACTGSKQLRERASHHTLWPNRNKSSTLSPRSALLATGMALLISKLRARSTRWACTAGCILYPREHQRSFGWERTVGGSCVFRLDLAAANMQIKSQHVHSPPQEAACAIYLKSSTLSLQPLEWRSLGCAAPISRLTFLASIESKVQRLKASKFLLPLNVDCGGETKQESIKFAERSVKESGPRSNQANPSLKAIKNQQMINLHCSLRATRRKIHSAEQIFAPLGSSAPALSLSPLRSLCTLSWNMQIAKSAKHCMTLQSRHRNTRCCWVQRKNYSSREGENYGPRDVYI